MQLPGQRRSQGKESVVIAHVFFFLLRDFCAEGIYSGKKRKGMILEKGTDLWRSKLLSEARGDGTLTSLPRDDSELDPGEMWRERSLIRKNSRCKGRRRDRAYNVWRSSGALGKREIRGGRQEKSPAALQEAAALGRTRASSGRTSAARSAHVRATDGELATGTKLITQGTSCVQRQVTTCCKRSTHQKRPHSFYNFKNQQPIHVGISAFTA